MRGSTAVLTQVRWTLPFVESLRGYNRDDFKKDLTAGVVVGVLLVPQGMAYALLAGLPPVYGLYASLFPTALYTIFGSSRQLSVGPVAMSSLLVLAGVGALAEPGSGKFISLAIASALFVGIVQVAFGAFKLGFLVNFLSHPVIKGFTAAAALIIAGSQLTYLLGIPLPRSNHIDVLLASALEQWQQVHLPTLAIGGGAILFMIILHAIRKAIPAALIAVIISTAVVAIFGLSGLGVETVGQVPRGLPAFTVPRFTYGDMRALTSLVFLLTFVSMIESIAIAKAVEGQSRHRLNPNSELIALGMSKILGAFFQAYPTTGSFSRTAVNARNGARTGVSSLVTAGLVALTLLFLTPVFNALPKAVLAAIIITAVAGLIDFRTAQRLWHTHRADFYMMLATFVATLYLGIIEGVLAGVILSLVLMIYRSTKPHVTELGRIPGSNYYRNVTRFPDALVSPETLIVRFDAPLFFGNANYFRDAMEQFIEEKGSSLKRIVLDASAIYDIDSSGANTLLEVVQNARTQGITVLLSGATGPLRDRLYKADLISAIGVENQFLGVHEAVLSSEGVQDRSRHALQTNVEIHN